MLKQLPYIFFLESLLSSFTVIFTSLQDLGSKIKYIYCVHVLGLLITYLPINMFIYNIRLVLNRYLESRFCLSGRSTKV